MAALRASEKAAKDAKAAAALAAPAADCPVPVVRRLGTYLDSKPSCFVTSHSLLRGPLPTRSSRRLARWMNVASASDG